MAECSRSTQTGMTLIEVLVSVLILAIGLLGAAAIQLNALKYTDSSRISTQASFIAYDMMDRIRANPDANYGLTSLSSAPTDGNLANPRTQDLFDFGTAVTAMGGAHAGATIAVDKQVVTITITWNDSRAANVDNTMQQFKLTSRVAVTPL
ncbi:type IV pilus modification protein PilV [Pseudomonas sp. DWP3-1-2]|uniref:type IV pilus modification protein PilV n=1 Tax=Pseudomonas sp. DWP3-1-2 TaxID=2804645 RepID=UPI003CF8D4F3